MTRQRHPAQPLRGSLARAGLALLLSALFVGGLGGCRRRALRPALPLGSLAPIELEAATDPDSLPLIESVPLPELGPLPPPPPAKPVPKKTPATKEEAQPPVQAAAAPESAALAIGVLSIGGDAAPQSQQTARDLIAAITKRIAALPSKIADARKDQVRQVRHFLDQAQQALTSGDAEGATNLATKAKLLMDDLEKK
jgi:hypothetical protein